MSVSLDKAPATNVEADPDDLVAESRCPLETRYGMGATILRCGRAAHPGDAWCLDHLVEYGYRDEQGRKTAAYRR